MILEFNKIFVQNTFFPMGFSPAEYISIVRVYIDVKYASLKKALNVFLSTMKLNSLSLLSILFIEFNYKSRWPICLSSPDFIRCAKCIYWPDCSHNEKTITSLRKVTSQLKSIATIVPGQPRFPYSLQGPRF